MHKIENFLKLYCLIPIPNNLTPLPDLTDNQISANNETERKS